MRKYVAMGLAVGAGMLAQPAVAKDSNVCGAGLICASKPASVTAAIKTIDSTVKVGTDHDKNPYYTIKSSSGYSYDIYFKDCDTVTHQACAALQFQMAFTKAPQLTMTLANNWNRNYRLSRAYINSEGKLTLDYDLSTIGGVTQTNLTDVKKWWDSQLTALYKVINGDDEDSQDN